MSIWSCSICTTLGKEKYILCTVTQGSRLCHDQVLVRLSLCFFQNMQNCKERHMKTLMGWSRHQYRVPHFVVTQCDPRQTCKINSAGCGKCRLSLHCALCVLYHCLCIILRRNVFNRWMYISVQISSCTISYPSSLIFKANLMSCTQTEQHKLGCT